MKRWVRREFLATGLVTALAGRLTVNADDKAKEKEASMNKELEKLASGHKGEVSIAWKNLKTGESWSLHGDRPMPTASLIKFPIMVETYRQAAENKVSLDKMLTLEAADKVPGSGILTPDFTPGSTLALRDAVRLMIKFSDNTATNLVLDEIGLEATSKYMTTLGCPNTWVHSKVYKRETSIAMDRSVKFGLGSTSSDEMIILLQLLHDKKLVSPEASKEMYAHLLTCDDTKKFPKFLPFGTKIAFKTGSVNASRTAAGIIETKSGPIALSVMTDKNQDESWGPDNAGDLVCAHAAKIVFDRFETKAG
jgi:beta-lactamase class A